MSACFVSDDVAATNLLSLNSGKLFPADNGFVSVLGHIHLMILGAVAGDAFVVRIAGGICLEHDHVADIFFV